ncbi:unnamed protein product [Meloidogyne enterolobii]|uniref:Uncharacterized protein n=1 Tax=Meloidogyne enterolobii TaxID=390850 RepID=A0ACB1AIF7_MELEN
MDVLSLLSPFFASFFTSLMSGKVKRRRNTKRKMWAFLSCFNLMPLFILEGDFFYFGRGFS